LNRSTPKKGEGCKDRRRKATKKGGEERNPSVEDEGAREKTLAFGKDQNTRLE
jgi:hypothetical protein